MAYCITSDQTGLTVLPVVYLAMLLGNVAFILLVFRPAISTYKKGGDFPISLVIEFAFYELVSIMMVWSHCAAMCVQPGFVPLGYKYQNDKLPLGFQFTLKKPIISVQRKLETSQFSCRRQGADEASNRVFPLEARNRSYIDGHFSVEAFDRAAINIEPQAQQSSIDSIADMVEKPKVPPITIPENNETSREAVFSPKEQSEMRLKYDRSCRDCKGVKPPRTHHCNVCGRCVMKMDHHCPWMNNCIGLNNQKAFMCFNFYVTLCAAWTVIKVVISCTACYRDKACTVFRRRPGLILTIIALVACTIFFMFTLIMFLDQAKLIMEDTSTIDEKQHLRKVEQARQGKGSMPEKRQIITGFESLKIAMGPNYLCWLVPVNIGIDLSVENQLNNCF